MVGNASNGLERIRELLRPDPALAERVVGEYARLDGRIFSAVHETVELADGSQSFREVVLHHGGAGVVALRDGEVCLVRQYRVVLGRVTLEIPAGKLELGEDPAICAARELAEETGLVAGRLDLVASVWGSPGFTNEQTSVFVARDLAQGRPRPDEGELVRTCWLPLEDVLAAIRAGLICDGKTVTGVFAVAGGLV